MKYTKKQSPPRVEDELTNRGLFLLDEEITKIGRIINILNKRAFELDDNGDYMPVEKQFFDPLWEENGNGDLMPRDNLFQLGDGGSIMPT